VHDLDGRFLYVNDAVCARHGYSREEFMAMHPWDFAVNVNQQSMMANLRAMVPGDPILIEDLHRCKDGSTFPVEARSVRFRDGGRDLIVAFVRDITSRRRVEDTLRMQERNRLAQDIHDTIASGLTAIAVQLEAARQVIRTISDDVAVHVDNALQTARESLLETRRSLQVLGQPVALGKGDLAEALRQLVGSRSSGRQEKLLFVLRGRPHPLPGGMEDHLLRIGQEALTNVLKHANATQVLVVLVYNPCDLILSIEDDGRGYDPERPIIPEEEGQGEKMGLSGMRDRAEQIGAKLVLRSVPGSGTTVTVTVPIPLSPDGSLDDH
jgi:PAS domain S-box-containing protein